MLVFCFWCQLHGQDRETFLVQIQDINTKLGCTIPTFTQGPYLRSTHCRWRGLVYNDGSISGSRGLSLPGHASNFWIMRAMQKHGKACARDKWWGWGHTSTWQGLDARGSAILALQDPKQDYLPLSHRTACSGAKWGNQLSFFDIIYILILTFQNNCPFGLVVQRLTRILLRNEKILGSIPRMGMFLPLNQSCTSCAIIFASTLFPWPVHIMFMPSVWLFALV